MANFSYALKLSQDGDDLANLNVADPRLFRDGATSPFFARLRREAPVHYCPESAFGPYWSVTRYADIQAIELDTVRFSSDHRLGGIALAGEPEDRFNFPMFIALDPPEHGIKRKTVAPMFTRSHVARLGDRIRTNSAQLLDALPIGETFDWVERVSNPLTAMTLAILFDFPMAEIAKLTHWSRIITAIPGGPVVASEDAKMAEMNLCFARFAELWQDKVGAPPAPDLLWSLANDPENRHLSQAEFCGLISLMLVAATDTTRNTISGSIFALDRHPDQYRLLRDDHGHIRGMMAETLRWHSPVAHMRRTATCDLELGGQQIRRGDKLALWYISGNHDEAAFPGAGAYDITRDDARRHLSFGHGIHRCVGAPLAELQMTILWEEILKRFPQIEVCAEPVRSFSVFMHGFEALHARIPHRL